MPHKKQQFRFRIPWISSGPSSKSHQSEPKSKEKVVREEPTRVGKGNDIIKHGSLSTSEGKIMFASSSGPKDMTKVAASSAEADPVIRKVSSISLDEKQKDEISEFDHKLATAKTPMDEKTVSVMTLAGENRGATMHVADSSHSQSNRKKGSKFDDEHGEENSSKEKDEAVQAYVNSNIQSMNNSFMSHGSITGRDPGVRVILPQQPEDKPSLENPKPEVNINRAERSSYRPTPTVRRRCLRGLFHEPSDSDPDKPRRHGCKVSCGELINQG